MPDELAEHLNALARDECYRVDAVLKEGPYETTERVYFQGSNGAEMGPFVRKRISRESGTGAAYERLCAAQSAGRRFRYLPRVFDCYHAGDSLVVVMEHVGGETLADVVYRCDPSLALACDVFPRLCEAVSELHGGFDVPLIHRDLKPSNVMLSRDSMTIIDFGIARAYREEASDDTRHFGTRAYAPPEQFGFGQTDVRSDVYALGMLLYFCLTERTPDAKARAAGFADPRIPESFRQVIAKAAAFDPQNRYASAADMKQAFLLAQGGVAGCVPLPHGAAGSAYLPPADAAGRAVALEGAPDAGSWPSGRPTGVAEGAARQGLSMPAPLPPSFSAWRVPGGRAPSARRLLSRPADLLSRIPLWLGVVWDLALASLVVLFVAVGASMVFDPEPGSSLASESLAYRAFGTAVVVFFFFVPSIFFLRDRRPLRRLFPRMRQPKLLVEAATVLGCFVLCVLLAGLLRALNL